MTDRPEWEKVLYAELEALPPAQRLIRYGELIMYLGRDLQSRLADERRELLLEILADPAIDDTRLAEMIGTRRTTIRRLKVEAKRAAKEKAKGVDGDPLP